MSAASKQAAAKAAKAKSAPAPKKKDEPKPKEATKAQTQGEGPPSSGEKGPGEEGYHDPPMTIWDHLTELRKRLVYAMIALILTTSLAWTFQADLFSFFAKPYMDAWHAQNLTGDPFNFKTPAEGFTAMFKLSVLGGLALAAPIMFWQLWAFVAPGLYKKEKRFVIPFVVSSTLLFVGGGYFGWKLVFPTAFNYLLGFGGELDPMLVFKETKIAIHPTIMISEYIDFVTMMLLGFGIVFEIPLLIFFLSVAGIVNYLQLIRYSRWYVVIAFAVAAILTPSPDVTAQLMMAIPMILLYGISILLAYFFGKPPSDAQRKEYAERKERLKKEREEDRLKRKAEKEARKRAKERGEDDE